MKIKIFCFCLLDSCVHWDKMKKELDSKKKRATLWVFECHSFLRGDSSAAVQLNGPVLKFRPVTTIMVFWFRIFVFSKTDSYNFLTKSFGDHDREQGPRAAFLSDIISCPCLVCVGVLWKTTYLYANAICRDFPTHLADLLDRLFSPRNPSAPSILQNSITLITRNAIPP